MEVLLAVEPPSMLSYLAGGLIMLFGVVLPLGYMCLKNRVPRSTHAL